MPWPRERTEGTLIFLMYPVDPLPRTNDKLWSNYFLSQEQNQASPEIDDFIPHSSGAHPHCPSILFPPSHHRSASSPTTDDHPSRHSNASPTDSPAQLARFNFISHSLLCRQGRPSVLLSSKPSAAVLQHSIALEPTA